MDLLIPAAHAGHWLIWVAYAVPLVIVVVAIVSQRMREAPRDEDQESPPA
jgi:hypothetical protein